MPISTPATTPTPAAAAVAVVGEAVTAAAGAPRREPRYPQILGGGG